MTNLNIEQTIKCLEFMHKNNISAQALQIWLASKNNKLEDIMK